MAAILLVEPDIALGRMYTSALEQPGYGVVWCRDGQTAIMAADEQRPDAVVIELHLAGHSGVEFLYEFRSYNEWRLVPIVVHTLVPPTDDGIGTSLWEQLHIAQYLYKPHTSLKRLLKCVDDVLPQPTLYVR